MYVGQRRLQTYPSTAGAQWGRVWDPQTRCVCTGTAFWDCQSPLISNASEEIFHSPFCCPLFPELSEHAGSPCSSLPITNVTSPSAAPELAVLAGSHGQKQQLTLFSPVCHTGNPKAITSIFCRKKMEKCCCVSLLMPLAQTRTYLQHHHVQLFTQAQYSLSAQGDSECFSPANLDGGWMIAFASQNLLRSKLCFCNTWIM